MRLSGLHKALLLSATVHGVVGAAVLAHLEPGRSRAIGQPLVAVLEAGGAVTSAATAPAGGDGPAGHQRPRHLERAADESPPPAAPADPARAPLAPAVRMAPDTSAAREAVAAGDRAARTETATRGLPAGRERLGAHERAAEVPSGSAAAEPVQQAAPAEKPRETAQTTTASAEPGTKAEGGGEQARREPAGEASGGSRTTLASRAASAAPSRTASPLAGNPTPQYPWLARRRGLEGEVILRVQVLPSGAAAGVQVESSSGYRVLDQAALESVQRWRFEPALRAGRAVPEVLRVPVRFELRGGRG